MDRIRVESEAIGTNLDDETLSYLEELVATPVGRRWMLKAGLASAVALGVGSRMGTGSAQAATRQKQNGQRTEHTDLHFAFGHVRGVTGMVLHANGKRVPLKRHTKRSRDALRRQGGLWGKMDLSQLSHHVSDVELPAERAILATVRGKQGRKEVVVGQLWRVPRASTIALAKTSHRLKRSYRPVLGSTRRLKSLGLTASQIRSPQHVAQLETVVDTSSAAVALASVHPNIATVNKTAAATTKAMLAQTPAVGSLDKYINHMQSGGTPYATFRQMTDPDGSATKITVNGETTTVKTFKLSSNSGLQQSVQAGVSAGVAVVRDTSSLGAVIDKPLEQVPAASTRTWVQPQGILPQTQPANGPTQLGAGISIQVTNPGFLFGTQTVVNGGYSNGQVPLKLYNNFVRWVWVYVQYLGPNNENLSANPSPTWPDTKYAQSLGLLPQVFTILGVPLWNTNSIDVTLNFPKDAHTARILYCGLGSQSPRRQLARLLPCRRLPRRDRPSGRGSVRLAVHRHHDDRSLGVCTRHRHRHCPHLGRGQQLRHLLAACSHPVDRSGPDALGDSDRDGTGSGYRCLRPCHAREHRCQRWQHREHLEHPAPAWDRDPEAAVRPRVGGAVGRARRDHRRRGGKRQTDRRDAAHRPGGRGD